MLLRAVPPLLLLLLLPTRTAHAQFHSNVVRLVVDATQYASYAAAGLPADVGWAAALAAELQISPQRLAVSRTPNGEVGISFRAGDCGQAVCGINNNQQCVDADGLLNDIFECVCAFPLVGRGVNGPAAACIANVGDCARNDTPCHIVRQDCVDADGTENDDFLCSCPWNTSVPAQPRLPAPCGADAFFNNAAAPDVLVSQLLLRAACCPGTCTGAATSTFCTAFGVTSVSTATPCAAFGSVVSACPNRCQWDAAASQCTEATPSPAPDDDSSTIRLAIIIVASVLYCLCMVMIIVCYRMSRNRGRQPSAAQGINEPLLDKQRGTDAAEQGAVGAATDDSPPPPPPDTAPLGAEAAPAAGAEINSPDFNLPKPAAETGSQGGDSNVIGNMQVAAELATAYDTINQRVAQARNYDDLGPRLSDVLRNIGINLPAHPVDAQPDGLSSSADSDAQQVLRVAPYYYTGSPQAETRAQSGSPLPEKSGDGPRPGPMVKTVDAVPPRGLGVHRPPGINGVHGVDVPVLNAVDPEVRYAALQHQARAGAPPPLERRPSPTGTATSVRLVSPPSAGPHGLPKKVVIHPLGGALPPSLEHLSPERRRGGEPVERPDASSTGPSAAGGAWGPDGFVLPISPNSAGGGGGLEGGLPAPPVRQQAAPAPPPPPPPPASQPQPYVLSDKTQPQARDASAGVAWPRAAPSPPASPPRQPPAPTTSPRSAAISSPATRRASGAARPEFEVQVIPQPEEAFGSLARASKGELMSPGGVGKPHEYERRRQLSPNHPSLLAKRMIWEDDPEAAAGAGVLPEYLDVDDPSVVGGIRTPAVPRLPPQLPASPGSPDGVAGEGSAVGYTPLPGGGGRKIHPAALGLATPASQASPPAQIQPPHARLNKTGDAARDAALHPPVDGPFDFRGIPRANMEAQLGRGGRLRLRSAGGTEIGSDHNAGTTAALRDAGIHSGIATPDVHGAPLSAATANSVPVPEALFELPVGPGEGGAAALSAGSKIQGPAPPQRKPIRLLPPDPRHTPTSPTATNPISRPNDFW